MKLKLKGLKTRVELSGVKRIYGLDKNMLLSIKEELTFDNPDYKSAIKFSRNSQYVRIPPYITCFSCGKDVKGNKYIETPLGYTNSFIDSLPTKDLRSNKEVCYPNFRLDLRDAQKEAEKCFIDKNSNNINGIIVLPTGKGKSILGLHLAYVLKQKTLIVVHKDDLVVGWNKDINLCFGSDFKSGLIKAKSRTVGEQITIATIQTLNRIDKEELSVLFNEFGLVILDEAHHCPASSYDLIMNFNSRYKLGLTATPERSDGLKKLMNLHFGDIAYKYETNDIDEDILPVDVINKEINIYVDPVCTKVNGRYTISYSHLDFWCKPNYFLSEGVSYSTIPYNFRPRLSNQIIEDYLFNNVSVRGLICDDIVEEYRKGSNIVCFLTQKKHIELFYNSLVSDYGVSTNYIQCYYGDSKLSSKDMIENAESGKVKITLTTYAKGTEGTNVKSWDTEFLISSVNNGKNVEQAVGRVRRVSPNKRKVAKVYDYSYPNAVILKNHYSTRLSRYIKLGFNVVNNSKRMFGR